MGSSALISGITGVTGRNLALHLESCGDWDHVYGISRRTIDFGKNIEQVKLDLTDAAKVKEGTAKLGHITHVFFCAYAATESPVKDVEVNHGMFVNTIEGLEAGGAQLQHVHFLSGTKWYGIHLGPNKTPFLEDDPRAMTPNFYYDMEDYCCSRRKAGASWTWGSVRPNPVCGFSTGSVMNLTNTIAVYASLCKELGLPFRFPGTWAAYTALLEVCDVELLAKAQAWVATTASAQDASYNVSNGDVFRWSEVWPKLGAYFRLPLAEPQQISLASLMADKEQVWERLKREHGLQSIAYNDLATWSFGDWVFSQEKDWFSNLTKLRQAGFNDMKLDTTDMFIRLFESLKADKIIPK